MSTRVRSLRYPTVALTVVLLPLASCSNESGFKAGKAPTISQLVKAEEQESFKRSVGFRFVEAEFFTTRQHLRRKCLVEFEEVNVLQSQLRLLQHHLHGRHGRDENVLRGDTAGRIGDYSGQGLRGKPCRGPVRCEHQGCRTIAQLRGISRRHGAIALERRSQFRQPFCRAIDANAFVLGNRSRFRASAHGDRNNLAGKRAVLPCASGTFVALHREAILVGS